MSDHRIASGHVYVNTIGKDALVVKYIKPVGLAQGQPVTAGVLTVVAKDTDCCASSGLDEHQ